MITDGVKHFEKEGEVKVQYISETLAQAIAEADAL